MLLINFGHSLTESQMVVVEELAGGISRTLSVSTQMDHARPFGEQARTLVDAVGLMAEEWQTMPLLISLPTLHNAAAAVLAELHGRCGYFPAVLRLRPVPDALPPRFEPAEIINLQAVRNAARSRR